MSSIKAGRVIETLNISHSTLDNNSSSRDSVYARLKL